MLTAQEQYRVLDDAISAADAARLLRQIRVACDRNMPTTVQREHGDRSLHYRVIDGDRAARDLPDVAALADRFLPDAQHWYGAPLVPVSKSAVAVNVNITPAGGTYRWHYDRNAVTLLVYLNAVVGGAVEVCPGYRIELPARWATSRAQCALDRVLEARPVRRLIGKTIVIEPKPCRLVMLRGRRCLHSVQPVEPGSPERVAVVLAFDPPECSIDPGDALDRYLYDTTDDAAGDPNYHARQQQRR